MSTQEAMREVANLRLRLRMNNRLRLESLAALSKVFREFGEPIRDELLASIVPAIPEELLGESWRQQAGGPGRPKDRPGRPPEPPHDDDEDDDDGPGRPPEPPHDDDDDGPGRPPEPPHDDDDEDDDDDYEEEEDDDDDGPGRPPEPPHRGGR